MYASVITDIGSSHVNQTFDYVVPDRFLSLIEPGMRVIVPFGNMTRMAFVVALHGSSELATKEIIDVVDVFPVISMETREIIDHLRTTTTAPEGALFRTAVSHELLMRYRKEAHLLDPDRVDDGTRAMFNARGIMRLKVNDARARRLLKPYVDDGSIVIRNVVESHGKALHGLAYTFNHEHGYHRIGHYPDVVSHFADDTMVTRKTLIESGISPSRIKTLLDHGVLVKTTSRTMRDTSPALSEKPQKPLDDVRKAGLQALLDVRKGPVLLSGGPGSGKDDVIGAYVSEVVQDGGTVLVLVPEIAKIDMVGQVLSQGTEDVVTYHSGMSEGARRDAFDKVQSGDAKVVLGTRSAIFLPVDRLKALIIMDAHDDQYIQSHGVRFDAREIAKVRTDHHGSPLVLVSATPGIATMHLAMSGTIPHVTLDGANRSGDLPQIHLVDMRTEVMAGHTGMLSRLLEQKIADRIAKGEQTVLLYNRKGYASHVACTQCGHVPKCPTCQIALTYYKDEGMLKCHYCGHKEPYAFECPVCHNPTVKESGVGLDYVTAHVKRRFPDASVVKIDAHIARTKSANERIWRSFDKGRADILVGTSMVVKGLGADKVTLSAVLMADQMFHSPSYTADEDAFHLFSDMTGRGSYQFDGESVIQGHDLRHIAIRGVTEGYPVFYKEGLEKRRLLRYPPFGSVARVTFEGDGYLSTYQEAFKSKKRLHNDVDFVLGPTPSRMRMPQGKYRFNIILKSKTIDTSRVFETLRMTDPSVRTGFVFDLEERT